MAGSGKQNIIVGALLLALLGVALVMVFLSVPGLHVSIAERGIQRERAAMQQLLATREAQVQAEQARVMRESAQVRKRELAAARARLASSAHHVMPEPVPPPPVIGGIASRGVASSPPPQALEHTPPTRTVADDERDLDRLLAQMKTGSIAFDTPASMNIRDTRTIQLLLDPSASVDQLKRQITAEGARAGMRIHVSQRMTARLTGEGFNILAIDTEQQWVPYDQTTQWRWDITPISSGPHRLHLTLDADVTVGGASAARSIRVFDRTIEVNVTLLQRVGGFVQHNWQWLWAAIVVPVLGGGLWRRRKRKAAEEGEQHDAEV